MKNNKSLEHLNVLLRIFFFSGVFQNFDVDFRPILKAEKIQNFIFFHPFESINFQPAGLLKIALKCLIFFYFKNREKIFRNNVFIYYTIFLYNQQKNKIPIAGENDFCS